MIDTIADVAPESDRAAESIGELDEARFKPVPAEVGACTREALARAFPETAHERR
jgi:hypothetical protein